ncbi:MAG: Ni/Fe hydrogenase subunit alpha [Geobacter sp.]|nr:Ni/Fe hydrogenase subunit alpha [Geobacter sp.]
MSEQIEISPLTRVEGHGKVTVHLDNGQVEKVTLSLFESPRLFEALLVGKSFHEVPEIICRICSLCSTVHRVCSLMAVEKALGIEVSKQTRLYRELILYGGHIQSHALHLFCLALPDYLDAQGFADLAAKAPEELKMGLRIKAAGNLIQERVGGRLIHPVTLIPGGMGKPLDRDGLLELKETLEAVLPDATNTFELFSTLPSAPTSLPTARFMAVMSDEAPMLIGERLETSDGTAFQAEEYRERLREDVCEGNNAKISLLDGEPVTVGALARLNMGTWLSQEASQSFLESKEKIIGADIRANSFSQAIELIHAVERSLQLIDSLLSAGIKKEKPPAIAPRKGKGTASIEAPRGTLIHSYSFDGRGLCTEADIITPTAINQAAMERDLLHYARALEGAGEEIMKLELEKLVRAYDPCISCAVHVISTHSQKRISP